MRLPILACGAILAHTIHATEELWRFNNLTNIGGYSVTVEGAPTLIDSPVGGALAFSGKNDSILIGGRPLVNATTFTAEVLLRPDGGPFAQRFMHIAATDPATGLDTPVSGKDLNPRLMFEIRVQNGSWALDVFAFSEAGSLTLLFLDKLHPLGKWSVVTQTFDGKMYSAFVDGVLQGQGELAFKPHGPGRVRAGARMNRLDYYQGAIALARFTDRALKPEEFLKVNQTLSSSLRKRSLKGI